MFEQLKTKKKTIQPVTKSQPIVDASRIGKTCPKCHYTRKENEQAPTWQCPNCQIAYNKFNAATGKLKKSLSTAINKVSSIAIKQKLKSLEIKATIISLPGFFTFLAGMSSEMCTCDGVVQAAKAANPILLLIGGALVIFSAVYYIRNRIRIKNEENE